MNDVISFDLKKCGQR